MSSSDTIGNALIMLQQLIYTLKLSFQEQESHILIGYTVSYYINASVDTA